MLCKIIKDGLNTATRTTIRPICSFRSL